MLQIDAFAKILPVNPDCIDPAFLEPSKYLNSIELVLGS